MTNYEQNEKIDVSKSFIFRVYDMFYQKVASKSIHWLRVWSFPYLIVIFSKITSRKSVENDFLNNILVAFFSQIWHLRILSCKILVDFFFQRIWSKCMFFWNYFFLWIVTLASIWKTKLDGMFIFWCYVVSKVCLLKLSVGLNMSLWAKSFVWDLKRSFCRMTIIFQICNIWGWRVLAKFFHKNCLNLVFHRARRKSHNFEILRFWTSSAKNMVQTIFMKKDRKDPPSSDITNLKYHGHTTKTSF